MAITKRFALRLSQGELETVQRLLEGAVAAATPEQVQQLQAIDSRVYRLLLPALVQEQPRKRLHPVSLRRLGVLRMVR
jgi:hypothetical protein